MQEMVNQSVMIFKQPGSITFRRSLSRGSRVDAVLYVASGACIVGILRALLLAEFGIAALLMEVFLALIGFFFFVAVVVLVGNYLGGMGTFDEIAYAFALFYVPITLVSRVVIVLMETFSLAPALLAWVGVLALLANGIFAYFAVQGSMHFRHPALALLTIGVALAILWVTSLVLY